MDGFHRWTLARTDPAVAALGDGDVPVVRLTHPLADQMLSTIRHNRARGQHTVLRMADIVLALQTEHGFPPDEVGRRLGMEAEEVSRLTTRVGQPDQHAGHALNKGWIPR